MKNTEHYIYNIFFPGKEILFQSLLNKFFSLHVRMKNKLNSDEYSFTEHFNGPIEKLFMAKLNIVENELYYNMLNYK